MRVITPDKRWCDLDATRADADEFPGEDSYGRFMDGSYCATVGS